MEEDVASASSRMLVVGSDDALRSDVVTRLHALCGQKADASALAQPLTLATKYYSATVDVHVRCLRENALTAALTAEGFEALVGVVDAARDESFRHVRGFLAQMAAREQPDVRLLVARNVAAHIPTPAARLVEELQSWCQEHEFELVKLSEDEGGDNQATDDREKRGMERVLEALQCNMWASMVMSSGGQGGGAHSEVDDSGLRELANVSVALATPDAADEQKTAAASSTRSNQRDAAAEGDEEDDEKLQSLLRALEITEATDSARDSTASTANQRSTMQEEEEDVDMAEFSALISEVRRVRDSGDTLTDEQRRQRAAEVAMKLWSFLGADDESDDE